MQHSVFICHSLTVQPCWKQILTYPSKSCILPMFFSWFFLKLYKAKCAKAYILQCRHAFQNAWKNKKASKKSKADLPWFYYYFSATVCLTHYGVISLTQVFQCDNAPIISCKNTIHDLCQSNHSFFWDKGSANLWETVAAGQRSDKKVQAVAMGEVQIWMMMMKWCLMSSDVSWHIRDKLWPMPKHGSINLYVHGSQKAR